MDEIPALEDLLWPLLRTRAKISSYEAKNLMQPGENYGSQILAVTVHLADGQDLHLVAKKCPESVYMQKMFNIGVTFKREINFYKTILPAMQDFQIRHNCTPIESFPKYYGSRVSLNSTTGEVDEGCCLLLENLKIKGYHIEDRMKGFNLDCTMFLLRDLATFHAVPVAMKLKEPQNFRNNIMRFMADATFTRESFSPELAMKLVGNIATNVNKLSKYSEFGSALEKHISRTYENLYKVAHDVVEPFGTLVHSDFWTNNSMIKFDASGKMIGNCFVDFQMLTYGNPAHDLMFFLFSSVEIPLIRRYYDDFINAYHQRFISVLRELKVDDLERFANDKFSVAIDRAMTSLQIYHCTFMMQPIYTMKERATEHSQLNEDTLADATKIDNEKYYEKLQLCIEYFVERGWLKQS